MNESFRADDRSGTYVGPPEDPDRFRLIALLGAGGEGEVWRASGDGRPVAVKISSAARSDPAIWEAWAQMVTGLRHPSLVRVLDAFVGPGKHAAGSADDQLSFRHEVMEFVEGISLADWVIEHPDASITERRRLLIQVAGALDALHDGRVAGLQAAHGDVKPHNIIVTPQGRAVLLDLGLARLTSSSGFTGRSNAYAPPEARAGETRADVRSDAYAFAVTAAMTYAGVSAPVRSDGYLDVDRLRRILRRSPRTRRRPLLRRTLMATLASSPERRPARLVHWVRRPQRFVVAAVIAAAVLASTAAVSANIASASHHTALPPPSDTPNVSPATAAASSSAVHTTVAKAVPKTAFHSQLSAQLDWPGVNASGTCSSATTRVAGPASVLPDRVITDVDIYSAIAHDGGGGWRQGTLTATFSAKPGASLRLLHIAIEHSELDPPAWVLLPAPDRAPTVTLGRKPIPTPSCSGTVETGPKVTSKAGWWTADVARNSVALNQGDGLPVTLGFGGGDTTFYTANVSAADCSGNYKWWLVVEYQQGNDRTVRTYTSEPVILYGVAQDSDVELGYQNGSGGATVVNHAKRSGSDPSCPANSAVQPFDPVPVPYPTSGTITVTPRSVTPTPSDPVSHSTPPSSTTSTSSTPTSATTS